MENTVKHSTVALVKSDKQRAEDIPESEIKELVREAVRLAGGFDFIEPQAYSLLNFAAHGKIYLGNTAFDLSLGVDNLLNTQYYSHLSRYKGLVFDQGFNFFGEIRIDI